MTTSLAYAKKQASRHASAPILVVTGLSREAACLGGGAGVMPLCSGANVRLLHAALLDLAEVEFSAVVSFGLAGGLDPALRPGDVAVGTTATSDGEHFGAHPALRKVLLNGFSGAGVAAREGAVAGVDAAVLTVAGKTALRGRSGGVAVDMELHLAGAFARRARLALRDRPGDRRPRRARAAAAGDPGDPPRRRRRCRGSCARTGARAGATRRSDPRGTRRPRGLFDPRPLWSSARPAASPRARGSLTALRHLRRRHIRPGAASRARRRAPSGLRC